MGYYNEEEDGFFLIKLAVGIALVAGLGGLGWAIRGCALAQDATFTTAEANVARRSVERSQAYIEGMRRDLSELMLAYHRAKTDDERSVILITLRHRAAGAPADAVPDDVRAFLASH